MRQQIITNTVHLSLFPPHENTHSQNKKKGMGEHVGFGEYDEVECDSAAEGSEMKSRKGCERWKPILPTCGRRSACPPEAERSRP